MALPHDWNQGGDAIPPYGARRPSIRDLLNAAAVAQTVAEAKALPAAGRFDGMQLVTIDGRRWRYSATSALASDGDQLVIVPDAGDGRFLALPGQAVNLAMPISSATLDGATLYTVPTGAALLVQRGYWQVVLDFTGGTGSAIGLSSGQAPHNTKGDLLGGATGDVAATLVVGNYIEGTQGADVADGIILRGGSTVLYDRITSAFTAGVGTAHLVATLLANPG